MEPLQNFVSGSFLFSLNLLFEQSRDFWHFLCGACKARLYVIFIFYSYQLVSNNTEVQLLKQTTERFTECKDNCIPICLQIMLPSKPPTNAPSIGKPSMTQSWMNNNWVSKVYRYSSSLLFSPLLSSPLLSHHLPSPFEIESLPA